MQFLDDPNGEGAAKPDVSVWDWFQSLLRLDPISWPSTGESEPTPEKQNIRPLELPDVNLETSWQLTPAKLRLPSAVFLAMVAQLTLANRTGILAVNLVLFGLGAGLYLWALLASDFEPPTEFPRRAEYFAISYRWRLLAMGVSLGAITFLTAGGNQFRLVTVISWVGSIILVMLSLWEQPFDLKDFLRNLKGPLQTAEWNLSLNRWHLLLAGSFLLVVFFRLDQLARVPYEMWSDQAEKLLDVRDVLEGDTKIFFARNSGREAVEFYWAALVSKVFRTGLSFLTLKIVSASAGLLALPFIYLLGKEMGGRRVGLFALLTAGMAFWPNITSRAGLRMPLNEMFVAPAMFFLVRGLRRGSRNDLLWSGLAVGIGLQGYSGARVLPLVILLGWILYLVHNNDIENKRRSVSAFSALVFLSILGALPLLRFLLDEPDQLLYRTLTRMGTLEQSYQVHPILQFLKNMWDILIMFGWNTGEIWVVTVPRRPALDWITGAFFHLGLLLTLLTYLRQRRWQSLYLLLSLPFLLLPSALALAFPNENPAPNRVTGAIVPAFILAAMALDSTYLWARRQFQTQGRLVAALLVTFLLVGIGFRNYRLVFSTYATTQRTSAWNASEAGGVMAGFNESVGDLDNVYFVVYPFWMDSRLVAIEAGAPIRDYSVWPEDLMAQQLDESSFHLFFLKPEDTSSMTVLEELYPRGTLNLFSSDIPGRDFYYYLVPPIAGVPVPLASPDT